MDDDARMTGIRPLSDLGPTDIGGDPRRQEAILLEFQARVAQDMAGIQNGLNCLMQQVEAVPAQVAAGMTKSAAPAGTWLPALLNWNQQQQNHEPAPPPPPHASAVRLAELQGENKVLGNRNIALHRSLADAQRELEAARRKVAAMESQLRDSQEAADKLRGKEAMLRTMILGQAGVQRISDDEMLQGFLKLRQDIQKIARSPCYSADTNPVLSAAEQDATTSPLAMFYHPSAWGMLTVGDRRLRMRAKMFDELHFYILDYNCFGLQGFQSSDETLAQKGPIELGLRRFEHMLKERGVGDNVISDWRISTINCVELSGAEETTTKTAAAHIFSFLAPLLSQNVRVSEKDALHASILDLCRDAYRLRMMMRKSKDKYIVETVKSGTGVSLSATESKADAVAVEGGKNSEGSDEIAYTMFGALTKPGPAEDQPVKVLEKAQVVLRRK